MDALLLLGATGAGKTPLGERLASHGLLGKRCLHFDFGACLRRAAQDRALAPQLDATQHAVVQRVLRTGALLEDHEFPIAAALLEGDLGLRQAHAEDLLVLNGLPRHRGQAEALAAEHRVIYVAHLAASVDVLLERIARNSGGDRAERVDDDVAQVTARIARYEARTAPLLEHYESHGARLLEVPVSVHTTATESHAFLAEELTAAE